MGEGGEDGLRLLVQVAAEIRASQLPFVDVKRLNAVRNVRRKTLKNLAVFLCAARVEQPQGCRLG